MKITWNIKLFKINPLWRCYVLFGLIFLLGSFSPDIKRTKNDLFKKDSQPIFTTTEVFTYTGSDQTFTIPNNVISVTAKIWGAGGRGDTRSGRGTGGAGGYTEFTIPVSSLANNTLILTVGQGGDSSLGAVTYGNGGAGFSSTFNGSNRNYGSGGGMSAVTYTTLSNPSSITDANILGIAGGGGTASAFTNSGSRAGVGGGTTGGDASDSRPTSGSGGTQTSGGASSGGNAGSFLQGGNAIQNGGAGGGGYYGGGSGIFVSNNEGSGGGGSGYLSPSVASGQTLQGTIQTPPMISDANYISGVGVGGNSNGGNGGNGLIVLILSTAPVDSDGDGVFDITDLDDDNDGIVDTVEDGSCGGSLQYEFYNSTPSGDTVDNIPTTGATGTGMVSDFDVDALFALVTPGDGNSFGIRYTGFITIEASDTYTFYTSSDDGSKLFIDDEEVVDNDGLHSVQERSGIKTLTAGIHSIEVLFFERGGGESLTVSYASSTITKTVLPFNILSCTNPDFDNDGIINSLDTDSDNDGCPDAIEAAGAFMPSDLDSDSSLGNISDSNGIPQVNGFSGQQNTTISVIDATDNNACFLDLSLTKEINKAILKVGGTAIFTLRLKNEGPLVATNVQVKDILPLGLTYDSGNSTIPVNTTYNDSTGIWDLTNVSIASGQTITIQIAATVTADGIKLNTAEIVSVNQTDSNSNPNNGN